MRVWTRASVQVAQELLRRANQAEARFHEPRCKRFDPPPAGGAKIGPSGVLPPEGGRDLVPCHLGGVHRLRQGKSHPQFDTGMGSPAHSVQGKRCLVPIASSTGPSFEGGRRHGGFATDCREGIREASLMPKELGSCRKVTVCPLTTRATGNDDGAHSRQRPGQTEAEETLLHLVHAHGSGRRSG